MNLCIECIFHQYQKGKWESTSHLCTRIKYRRTCPVTGQIIAETAGFCHDERKLDDPNDCGPEGKFFEAKGYME